MKKVILFGICILILMLNVSLVNSDYSDTNINILNKQSHPELYGNWTVAFNMTGEADLTITAINGTSFGKDLEFLELRCGDVVLSPVYDGNRIFYKDYNCAETSYLTNKVLTAGEHTLEFRFGLSIGSAYNTVTTTSGEECISVNSVTYRDFTFKHNLPYGADEVDIWDVYASEYDWGARCSAGTKYYSEAWAYVKSIDKDTFTVSAKTWGGWAYLVHFNWEARSYGKAIGQPCETDEDCATKNCEGEYFPCTWSFMDCYCAPSGCEDEYKIMGTTAPGSTDYCERFDRYGTPSGTCEVERTIIEECGTCLYVGACAKGIPYYDICSAYSSSVSCGTRYLTCSPSNCECSYYHKYNCEVVAETKSCRRYCKTTNGWTHCEYCSLTCDTVHKGTDSDGDGWDDRCEDSKCVNVKCRQTPIAEICGNGCDDNCNGVIDDGCNLPPKQISLTITPTPVKKDDETIHTITFTAEDGDGVNDIGGTYGMMAMIFKDTHWSNARGYFAWHPDGAPPGFDTNYQEKIECTGGGYASKYSAGYGSAYTSLVSCETSTSGNQRTVKFNFKAKPTPDWITIDGYDIAGYVTDKYGHASGWQDYFINFRAVQCTSDLDCPQGFFCEQYISGVTNNANYKTCTATEYPDFSEPHCIEQANINHCEPSYDIGRGNEVMSGNEDGYNSKTIGMGAPSTDSYPNSWWCHAYSGQGDFAVKTNYLTSDTDLCLAYVYDPCTAGGTLAYQNAQGTRGSLGAMDRKGGIPSGCAWYDMWVDLSPELGTQDGYFSVSFDSNVQLCNRDVYFGWVKSEQGITDGTQSTWCCDNATDCVDDAPGQGYGGKYNCYNHGDLHDTNNDGREEQCNNGVWIDQDESQLFCEYTWTTANCDQEISKCDTHDQDQTNGYCCGDDANEHYRVSTGAGNDGTDACCNSSDKCVLDNVCYANEDCSPNGLYCNEGTWRLLDFDQDGIDNECDIEGPDVEATEQSLLKVYKEPPTPLPEESCNDGIDNDGDYLKLDGGCDYEGCVCNENNNWCGTGDSSLTIIAKGDPDCSECPKCTDCGGSWWDLNLCDRDECNGCAGGMCYFIDRVVSNECNACTTETTCEDYDDATTCVDDPCNIGGDLCAFIDDICCLDSDESGVCDKNEFYQRTCASLSEEWWAKYHKPGDPGEVGGEYYACQPDPADIIMCPKYSCVYDGECYNYGDKKDIDGDGIFEVCKAPPVLIPTLDCYVKETTCKPDDITVFKISSLTNAHAELYTGNYPYHVCCGVSEGILNNDCGTTILTLSTLTNAHAASDLTYAYKVCLYSSIGTVQCNYDKETCAEDETCLVSISGPSNAHVADCTNDPYAKKVCCKIV